MRRLLMVGVVVLMALAAAGAASPLEPAIRSGHGYVYNAPGKLNALVSDGTTRVAAFVSERGTNLVVLWHPGEAGVTALAAPAGSHLADLENLHFEGGAVVWSNADQMKDWEWNGRGKPRVADHAISPPSRENVLQTRGFGRCRARCAPVRAPVRPAP